MEFLCELIFELLLEGVFGLTVRNPKVKTWVKTVFMLLFTQTVAGLIGWFSVQAYLNGNTSGGIGGCVIAAGLGIGFLVVVVYGHKREWKQDL